MDWEHLYFRYWSPFVDLSHGEVSADAVVKRTILTLTTQPLTIFIGETCRVDDLLNCAARNLSNFITQSICFG